MVGPFRTGTALKKWDNSYRTVLSEGYCGGGSHEVVKGHGAEQCSEEVSTVHEVHVQALRAVLVVAVPQLTVAQHLKESNECVSLRNLKQ